MQYIYLVDILDRGRSGTIEWELPLGLMTLSSQLRLHGYQTKVHQITPSQTDELIERITSTQPLFIGLSGVFSYFAAKQLEFARRLKAKIFSPIIIGGPAVTMTPNLYMEHSEFDFVMIGEAEESVLSFADALLGNVDFKVVHGLCYRNHGEVMFNDPAIHIDVTKYDFDLDSINVPWNRYVRNGVLFSFRSSRGCPYRCTFCYNSGHKNPFRSYPIDKIVNRLLEIRSRTYFKQVRMIDDHLFANKNHAYRLMEALSREGINLYNSDARAENIDVDYLNFLKNNNMQSIYFGYESENPRILKIMNKCLEPERVISALESSKQVPEVTLSTQLMVGVPDQTRQEVISTCLHFLWLQRHYPRLMVHIVVFNPIPGTVLYKRAVELGFPPPMTLDEIQKQMLTSIWKYLSCRYEWLPWANKNERDFLNRIYIITFSINALIRNNYVPMVFKKFILSRYEKLFKRMKIAWRWENVVVRSLWGGGYYNATSQGDWLGSFMEKSKNFNSHVYGGFN